MLRGSVLSWIAFASCFLAIRLALETLGLAADRGVVARAAGEGAQNQPDSTIKPGIPLAVEAMMTKEHLASIMTHHPSPT